MILMGRNATHCKNSPLTLASSFHAHSRFTHLHTWCLEQVGKSRKSGFRPWFIERRWNFFSRKFSDRFLVDVLISNNKSLPYTLNFIKKHYKTLTRQYKSHDQKIYTTGYSPNSWFHALSITMKTFTLHFLENLLLIWIPTTYYTSLNSYLLVFAKLSHTRCNYTICKEN